MLCTTVYNNIPSTSFSVGFTCYSCICKATHTFIHCSFWSLGPACRSALHAVCILYPMSPSPLSPIPWSLSPASHPLSTVLYRLPPINIPCPLSSFSSAPPPFLGAHATLLFFIIIVLTCLSSARTGRKHRLSWPLLRVFVVCRFKTWL